MAKGKEKEEMKTYEEIIEKYRDALAAIRDMAASKKRINMQDGISLETFCRQTLLECGEDPDVFIGEMP